VQTKKTYQSTNIIIRNRTFGHYKKNVPGTSKESVWNLLTEETNKFAIRVVSFDSIMESPYDIVASWGLPSTEYNANPSSKTKQSDISVCTQ
jgi:hypothetical protein